MKNLTREKSLWEIPPVNLRFGKGDVHVWKVSLDQRADTVSALSQIISEDEKVRAAAFYAEGARDHYIVGRGFLRQLLGRYLAADPSSFSFAYGSHGKPILEGAQLAFNVSHSRGLALLAFAPRGKLGVDVEAIRPISDMMKIAERFYAVQEIDCLRALPADRRQVAFFHGWARKEAYLKAQGGGISVGLDHFSVSMDPADERVQVEVDGEVLPGWTIHRIDVGTAYSAAVAVEGEDVTLSLFEWVV